MELIIIDLNKEKIDVDLLYNKLPENIKQRVDRYKIAEDRIRSIVAWSIVHEKVDLNDKQVYYNQNGKPYIKDQYFSISHSHNFVGVLFDTKECGFDIEKVIKRDDKVARKILDEKNLKVYNSMPDVLIKNWTQIEAYGKALGIGIRLDMVQNLPDDIITENLIDTLGDKYYYSIYIRE